MAEIGIRELKQRVSQILREVREKGETYTITYQGKPCGLLIPYPAAGTKKKGKGQGKGGGLASLRGILRNTPEVPFEEFTALKKVWMTHVGALAEQLAEAGKAGQPQDG